ncbi:AAA family ATPase [Vagococcus sp. PNs007]|uniref:AAA family ATPase n=1 Tax=Vagococcus proximus TaxID=2991417 RepID=A0ABT5WYX5_9ENTE|nr:AAA family ATPase [Vagococcus proximus]MDF0478963.1 AAA family ATPase [Vagococcus proximus]
MELIYTYLKEYNGIQFNFKINYSSDFRVEFINNMLKINSISSIVPNGFYGDNIKNINLLVGKNGIGKTTLLNFITNEYDSKDFINLQEYSGFNLYKSDVKDEFYIDIVNLNIKNLFIDGDVLNNIFRFSVVEGTFYSPEPVSGSVKEIIIGINHAKRNKKTIKSLFEYNRGMIKVKYMENVKIFDKLDFINHEYLDFVEKNVEKKGYIKNKKRREAYVNLDVNFLDEDEKKEIESLYNEIFEIKDIELRDMGMKREPKRPRFFYDGSKEYLRISEVYLIPDFYYYYSMNSSIKDKFAIQYLKNIILEILTDIKNAKLTAKERLDVYTGMLEFANGHNNIKKFPYIDEKKFRYYDDSHAFFTKMNSHGSYDLYVSIFEYIGFLMSLSEWVNKRTSVKDLDQKINNLRKVLDSIYQLDESFFCDQFTLQIKMGTSIDRSIEQLLKIVVAEKKTLETRGLVYDIPFFSSGENHLIEHFVSIFKFIQNERAKNIMLLIDEPDIYLHPDWVREYIERLSLYLNKKYSDKNFQIIITTHSFLLVSDIPKNHVHKLNIDNNLDEVSYGFGSNFYDIINDSFFLNNSIGEFSSNKIKLINKIFSECLSSEVQSNESMQKIVIDNVRKLKSSNSNKLMELKEAMKILELTINIIDDPLYKNLFLSHFKELKERLYETSGYIDSDFLNTELEKYKEIIKNLEEKIERYEGK